MPNAPEEFSWHCPTCGRRVPRRVQRCHCGFRQNAHGSVTNSEPSRTRLLLVVLVGVAALGMRTYLAPTDVPVPAPAPVTASLVAPAAPAPARDAGAEKKGSAVVKKGDTSATGSAARAQRRPPDRRRRDQPDGQRRGRWFSFLPFVD